MTQSGADTTEQDVTEPERPADPATAATVAAGGAVERPSRRKNIIATLFRLQSLFGLIVMFVIAVILSPVNDGENLFLSADNLFNIVRAASVIGIMAIGMTFVILIGGIDLSVGSMLGLASTGVASLMVDTGLGILPSVLIVLAVGAAFGALQGIGVARFGIQAFIITLAGLSVARGLARIWTDGEEITLSYGGAPGQAPLAFSLLGERTFGGTVPIPALFFLAVAVLAIVFLRVTAFSRHIYAIGGNEKAARLSGVPVLRVKIIVFAICGLLAALAGIIYAGEFNQGSPNTGVGYELNAIAAVVVGGTALTGGRGSVVGTIAGALLLGVLNNILTLNGVDTNIQLLITGLVIVAAAGLQRLRPTTV